MNSPRIVYSTYTPGDLGQVIWLHGDYYHRHWGFDLSFEAQEAQELAEFLLRLDAARDIFLVARAGAEVAGAIAIDGGGQAQGQARLRWFIVAERFHGLGLGWRLLSQAVDFCRQAGHDRVFLWTFEGLTMARRLYERAGFALTEERLVEQWGGAVREQRFDLVIEG